MRPKGYQELPEMRLKQAEEGLDDDCGQVEQLEVPSHPALGRQSPDLPQRAEADEAGEGDQALGRGEERIRVGDLADLRQVLHAVLGGQGGAHRRDVQDQSEGAHEERHGQNHNPEGEAHAHGGPRLQVLETLELQQDLHAQGDGAHECMGHGHALGEAAVDDEEAGHDAEQHLLQCVPEPLRIQGLQHLLGGLDMHLLVGGRGGLCHLLFGVALLRVLALVLAALLGRLCNRSIRLHLIGDLLEVLIDGHYAAPHAHEQEGEHQLSAKEDVLKLGSVEEEHEAQHREK
mmetsp:Transcript_112483/g.363200  ORF Transcript_112483/g.363200 Transcript_112483/m.363200 type:complete len:289 (+) Transcript_112483:94-960(+)